MTEFSEAIEKLKAASDADIARCLEDMRVPKELVGIISLGDLMNEGARRLKDRNDDVSEAMVGALLDLEMDEADPTRIKKDHRHLIAKWTARLKAMEAVRDRKG